MDQKEYLRRGKEITERYYTKAAGILNEDEETENTAGTYRRYLAELSELKKEYLGEELALVAEGLVSMEGREYCCKCWLTSQCALCVEMEDEPEVESLVDIVNKII